MERKDRPSQKVGLAEEVTLRSDLQNVHPLFLQFIILHSIDLHVIFLYLSKSFWGSSSFKTPFILVQNILLETPFFKTSFRTPSSFAHSRKNCYDHHKNPSKVSLAVRCLLLNGANLWHRCCQPLWTSRPVALSLYHDPETNSHAFKLESTLW